VRKANKDIGKSEEVSRERKRRERRVRNISNRREKGYKMWP